MHIIIQLLDKKIGIPTDGVFLLKKMLSVTNAPTAEPIF